MSTELSIKDVVDGNLDMQDVLTVAVSRAETVFTDKLTATKKDIKKLEAEINNVNDVMRDQYIKDCHALAKDMVDKLKAVLEPFGGEVKVEPSNGIGSDTMHVNVYMQGTIKQFSGFALKADLSQEVVAMRKNLTELQEELKAKNAEAIEWKKKLSNIPQLQRQYQAKIAEYRLNQTTRGAEILKLLTEDLEQKMLALPSM